MPAACCGKSPPGSPEKQIRKETQYGYHMAVAVWPHGCAYGTGPGRLPPAGSGQAPPGKRNAGYPAFDQSSDHPGLRRGIFLFQAACPECPQRGLLLVYCHPLHCILRVHDRAGRLSGRHAGGIHPLLPQAPGRAVLDGGAGRCGCCDRLCGGLGAVPRGRLFPPAARGGRQLHSGGV